MKVLIDTNVAIFLIDRRKEVRRRIETLDEPPVISIITLIELEGGVRKEREHEQVRRAGLDALLDWVTVLPLQPEFVKTYGDIVATVGFSRQRLLDRLIAATALAHDLTLVTTNGPDFANIPGLKLIIWPRPTQ